MKRLCKGSPCDVKTRHNATWTDDGKAIWKCQNCGKESPRAFGRNRERAKDIRDSLKHQPAYLNTPHPFTRMRIYDAVAKRDGSLQVKVIKHTPGQLGHGAITWIPVTPSHSVSIFAGTAMEEVLTVVIPKNS